MRPDFSLKCRDGSNLLLDYTLNNFSLKCRFENDKTPPVWN